MTLDWFSRLQGSWKKCYFSCECELAEQWLFLSVLFSQSHHPLHALCVRDCQLVTTDVCQLHSFWYWWVLHSTGWLHFRPTHMVSSALLQHGTSVESWIRTPSLSGAAGCLRQFALWSALPATSTGFNSAVLWEFPSSTSVVSEHWWRSDHGSLMNSL